MLGRAERVAGRRVHHHDAEPRGGGVVDVVGADAGPHDRLQPAVALERLGRDLHAAAADGAVELGQGLAQVVALEAGADFVGQCRARRQQIETFLRERIENDDRGHDDRVMRVQMVDNRSPELATQPRGKSRGSR